MSGGRAFWGAAICANVWASSGHDFANTGSAIFLAAAVFFWIFEETK